MKDATQFILSIPIAAGRLRVARKRGLKTTTQEVDLGTAHTADVIRHAFSPDRPLTPDHRDMLLAVVREVHRETWLNTTDTARYAYWESYETSVQFGEMSESFDRFVNGEDGK